MYILVYSFSEQNQQPREANCKQSKTSTLQTQSNEGIRVLCMSNIPCHTENSTALMQKYEVLYSLCLKLQKY